MIVKYKPMIKHGNQYCLTLQFSQSEFTEDFRQQFLQDVCAEALEKRDSMYRITRAINMLSDFTQFHVIFRQYCTPKTDFSEEYMKFFQNS